MASSENRKRLANAVPEDFLKEIAPKRVAKSTSAATNTAVKNFLTFCGDLNMGILEEMTKENLKYKLLKFYAGCRTEKGEMYKVNSMHTIRNGLQRYFLNNRKFDIINGEYFAECNQCFNHILSQIKTSEKGTTTHHVGITPKDLLKLYKSFDLDSPMGLLEKVWLDIMIYFVRRGREDLRGMTLTTFDIGQDEDGMKYIYETAGVPNTIGKKHLPNKGPLSCETLPRAATTSVEGKMYETGTTMCPFKTFFLYKSKLNPSQDSLWQRPKKNWLIHDKVWYENMSLGVKLLGHMMTNLSQKYRLSRRYTNLCIRFTSVQTLNNLMGENYHANQQNDTYVYVWTGQLNEQGKLTQNISSLDTNTGVVGPPTNSNSNIGYAKPNVSTNSLPYKENSDNSTNSEEPQDNQASSPTKSTNDIPRHIWDILPDSANYLKELMIFAGYDTVTSVSRLDSKAEREKMIQFAINVNEGLDEAQRKRIFGFFHKIPEKLMILPGVEIIFDEFIRAVNELKVKSRSESTSSLIRHSSGSVSSLTSRCTSCSSLISESSESITNDGISSTESIREQISKLFSKQNKTIKFNLADVSSTPNCFLFTCRACYWRTNIVKDADNRISLKNIQHHFKSNRCQNELSEQFSAPTDLPYKRDSNNRREDTTADPYMDNNLLDPDFIKIEIDEHDYDTRDVFEAEDAEMEKEYFL